MPDATTLKRFFREQYQIAVRVESSSGKSKWVRVWVPSERRAQGASIMDPLRYTHTFPAELGNRCMRLAYPESETLREQNWGGNISSHSIALYARQWETLIEQFQPASA